VSVAEDVTKYTKQQGMNT